MSDVIRFCPARHSIAAYRDAIEQSTQAVVEWLKQPEMYQGKTVEQLRERINLNFTSQGLGQPCRD